MYRCHIILYNTVYLIYIYIYIYIYILPGGCARGDGEAGPQVAGVRVDINIKYL
jgi:hypothetical protein